MTLSLRLYSSDPTLARILTVGEIGVAYRVTYIEASSLVAFASWNCNPSSNPQHVAVCAVQILIILDLEVHPELMGSNLVRNNRKDSSASHTSLLFLLQIQLDALTRSYRKLLVTLLHCCFILFALNHAHCYIN